MFTDLITRPEACALFGMCRSTFMTYSSHYADFPQARGVKNRLYLYSTAELTAFFEEHAPKYAAKAKEHAEGAA